MNTLRNHLLSNQAKQIQFNQRVQQLTAPQQNTVRRIKGLGGEIVFTKR